MLNIGWVTGDVVGDVAIGDSQVSRLIELNAPGVGGQPRLSMTIDSSSGVPRCTRIELVSVEGGREVRATDLRAVQPEYLIEALVPLSTVPVERHDDGSVTAVVKSADSDSQDFKRARSLLRDARRKETRRIITPELLEEVAAVYAANPDAPARAVRLDKGVSSRTAHRYVAAARKANLIPERSA